MVIFSTNIFINLLITSLTVVTLVAVYFKWVFNYWKRKGVYTPPPRIPFGNTTNSALQRVSIGEDIRAIYQECKSRNLRYGGLYVFTKPIFLLCDPELIKNILTKDFSYFTDHGHYVNEEIDPLSGNLFGLKGLKWKNLRTQLTPAFTAVKMKMMFQTLLDCSDELLIIMDKISKENESVNIKDVMERFTIDVIASCGFGIECNSLKNPNSEFRKFGKKIFELDIVQSVKSFLANCFPELLDILKIKQNRRDVTEFFMNIVSKTVEYREVNNVARKDFMHLLIQLRNKINIHEDYSDNLKQSNSHKVEKALTLSELAAQAYVFFAAGFETSSTTLSFCFYELVQNPEVQEKLRQEIQNVLEKHNGIVSYEALTEMTYMDKCINETLRKYPPAPFLSRECNKPYRIPESDLVIDKDTLVFLPILGMQHDSQYYPDPEKFDPERFSPESKATRHPYTWLPFGEGPRGCIGIRFGFMQTKVALTVLLRNYMFSLNSKTEKLLFFEPKNFALSFKGTIWLNAKKLTDV